MSELRERPSLAVVDPLPQLSRLRELRTPRVGCLFDLDRGLDHRAAVLPGPEIKVAVSRDGCAMGARYAGSAPLDRSL